MIKLKDTISKIVGIVTVQFFLIDGALKTAKSAWKGPIGGTIRGVGKLF